MNVRWLTNVQTLNAKLKLAGILGICCTMLTLAAVFFLISKREYYHQLALHKQTTFTQGVAFYQELTAPAPHQRQLQDQSQHYIQSLTVLAKGGLSDPPSSNVLQAAPEHITLLANELISQAQNPALPQDESARLRLSRNNDFLRQALESYIQEEKQVLSWYLVALGAANVLLILLLYTHFKKAYVQRLQHLSVLASGNWQHTDVKSSTSRADEIGLVSSSLENLMQEVKAATGFIQLVGKGELAPELRITSANPGTQALFQELNGMHLRLKAVAEEDRQRNWSTQGLARFVDILRSKNDDISGLSEAILSELVRYTKSNQGALFFTEKGEHSQPVLRQYACFAFDRKKWHEREVKPGEGMVGQCFLEKQSWHLTEVPAAYIHITSGLGDAPPTALLIVPLMINEDVVGVVELAGFTSYPEYQIKFVEKLGENIAATITNVRTAVQTKELLKETQLMAENLQAQEEEVRQNMEELEATQEELHRKMQEGERLQQELTARMSALDASALMSESDTFGNITYVNNKFCEVAKYSREEVIGKPHNILRHPDNSKELFKEMWDTIKAGKIFKGRYPNRAKDGSTYWVDATIVPVLGDNGKPVKYIGLRFDITEQMRSAREVTTLLEEANNKASELQAQEEELRQNMEEMQAIQEELERRMKESESLRTELDARMKALDATALLSESDLYGNITYVNSKFCEVAKYSAEEVLGKPHNILRHPDNSKELFKEMWATIKAGKIFTGRYPNRAKDGSTYWVDATLVPVLGEDGKPYKYIGIRLDITEQIQKEQEAQEQFQQILAAEEELRQNMEEMQAIQEELHRKVMENQQIQAELDGRIGALDAAAILSESDSFGTITYVNSKFCEISKYEQHEVIGKPHSILRHPEVPKAVFASLWSTIKAGKVFKGRYPNYAKDGSVYWVEATIVPVLGESGKPVKYIGIRFPIEREEDQVIKVFQSLDTDERVSNS